jgi:hypothetical protein
MRSNCTVCADAVCVPGTVDGVRADHGVCADVIVRVCSESRPGMEQPVGYRVLLRHPGGASRTAERSAGRTLDGACLPTGCSDC